jgi:hypothetical protein
MPLQSMHSLSRSMRDKTVSLSSVEAEPAKDLLCCGARTFIQGLGCRQPALTRFHDDNSAVTDLCATNKVNCAPRTSPRC